MPPSWARVHSYNGQNRNFYFKVKVEFKLDLMIGFEIAVSPDFFLSHLVCRSATQHLFFVHRGFDTLSLILTFVV